MNFINLGTEPKTIQENVSEWNKFFKGSELANMAVKDIKPITLIRFFRKITKNRDITYKRLSNARSVLNGIMNYAIEEHIYSISDKEVIEDGIVLLQVKISTV